MEDKILEEYLSKFNKKVNPEYLIKEGFIAEATVRIGDEIIEKLKGEGLTYVDAYAILEYAYKKLGFMSEYTHL